MVDFSNLLMPPLLFFMLGFGMRLVRSDLEIPANFVKVMSIYLMVGIGLHGGMQLGQHQLTLSLQAMLVAFGGGVVQTALSYLLLKHVWRLDALNSAALAAHYGSVSLATFLTAVAFLKSQHISYESYPFVMLAIMESPGIFVGLFLAQHARARGNLVGSPQVPSKNLHIFLGCLKNDSVLLLIGSMLIGYLCMPQGTESLLPFYTGIFQGVLSLFLLAMGADAALYAREFTKVGLPLVCFAILMPLLGGALGVLVAHYALSFGVGGCVLVAALGASASYIAVPPAMRLAIPEARTSVALTLSLGVTFPFNVMLGIPLYLSFATWLLQ
ncbi:MAG: sodium-dependent bicarbonate transport family permease [Alphaproteobacteria bacterium]